MVAGSGGLSTGFLQNVLLTRAAVRPREPKLCRKVRARAGIPCWCALRARRGSQGTASPTLPALHAVDQLIHRPVLSTLNSQPSTNLVNCPRISPEDSGELSAGKLGSRIGVDISKLWFGISEQPRLRSSRWHGNQGSATAVLQRHHVGLMVVWQ